MPHESQDRSARILDDAGADGLFHPNDVPDEDYWDFDHYTITRVEPGKLWLAHFAAAASQVGPIAVPTKAADLLQEGWDISCALVRLRGNWRLAEVANVYPH